METIQLELDGKTIDLKPSWRFVKQLRRIVGSGNLYEVAMKTASLDAEVMAQVLHAGLVAAGEKHYKLDDVGDAMMEGDLTGYYGDDVLNGMETAAKLVNLAIEQLTQDKDSKSGDSEKN